MQEPLPFSVEIERLMTLSLAPLKFNETLINCKQIFQLGDLRCWNGLIKKHVECLRNAYLIIPAFQNLHEQ